MPKNKQSQTLLFFLAIITFAIIPGCQNNLVPKQTMNITSPSFNNSEKIPPKFTCQGRDISPELNISGVPSEALSLALIMEDPDAPVGTWVHWVIWNIDPKTTTIVENSFPLGSVQGNNSWPKQKYGGPCPPSGTHRYFFKLYALKDKLAIPSTSDKEALLKAMDGLIIDEAQLMGIYRKTADRHP